MTTLGEIWVSEQAQAMLLVDEGLAPPEDDDKLPDGIRQWVRVLAGRATDDDRAFLQRRDSA